ncbi:globin domain-containing protein [Luteolibacter sp. SL250]|uniref:globin domain-containing protein n=1 Tax=Luteolibacter sp. SL250 TaxID=2995170 RepID=UPI0022708440|nr:globin domain-containing protein [Luteolibacter sp. SL250]WAC20564.1 globin domain-containing protein [Luteolibacter sp. SL250]
MRKSFALLERQSHVAALVFYQNLFKLNPELRASFDTDIESRAFTLMDKLANALSLLEKPDELIPALEDLGAKHLEYESEADNFKNVAAALLLMLSNVLGKSFDEETRAAWIRLCEVVDEYRPKLSR